MCVSVFVCECFIFRIIKKGRQNSQNHKKTRYMLHPGLSRNSNVLTFNFFFFFLFFFDDTLTISDIFKHCETCAAAACPSLAMLHFFSLQQLCFHCFCFWWWWQSQRKENRKKSGLEIYAKEERHCTRETFLHFNEANVRRSKDRIKDVGRVVCRTRWYQHHVVYDCLHWKLF